MERSRDCVTSGNSFRRRDQDSRPCFGGRFIASSTLCKTSCSSVGSPCTQFFFPSSPTSRTTSTTIHDLYNDTLSTQWVSSSVSSPWAVKSPRRIGAVVAMLPSRSMLLVVLCDKHLNHGKSERQMPIVSCAHLQRILRWSSKLTIQLFLLSVSPVKSQSYSRPLTVLQLIR